ncbi:SMI1/KNR4 family protein [Pseudomonas kitaguniensis]|uniref:SMI1/KNR4 family protein n=1 Tax=Pseudomonas kitaguniensis TaxID=2607908 RepID=UPI003D018FE3
MIPEDLVSLLEKQPGSINRTNKELALSALKNLGVSQDSEFGEIFINYIPAEFKSSVSNEYICDLSEPTEEILSGTEFVQDMWELPENYVAFTSLQGEGAYLLDKDSGGVWDFDLGQQKEFVSGLIPPKWSGFFEFIRWYLSPAEQKNRIDLLCAHDY